MNLGQYFCQFPFVFLQKRILKALRCIIGNEVTCIDDSDMTDVSDASETVWGKYLMEEFRDYLDCQIRVMTHCVRQAEQCDGMEKPVLNLKDTLHQLIYLRESETWDEITARKTIDYGRLVFPKKNSDPDLAERIKAVRNACKKGLEKKLHSFADSSDQVLNDLKQSAEGARGIISLVRQFDRAYSQAKRSRRCLDFSDLEHKTLDLLLGKTRSGITAAAGEISTRFREIMVDEYQDSNGVQDAIFSALTAKKQNCFMVGDVKQSIYQFRLADPGIFLEKYRDYHHAKEAQPMQGRKVLLSRNFRSGGEIIEAVNHVFSTCMTPTVGGLYYGDEESLREGIPHDPLPDPAVELHALQIREDTYAEEAAFVAQKIKEMIDSKAVVRKNGGLFPVSAEDIVILLRSPGSVGGQFQRALEGLGIRCASGGGGDLLQTQEIGTFRSLLQTIYNPRQDIPLISTLASPIFGFTADDLASFRSKQRKGSVYDALLASDIPKVREFLSILVLLRKEARMNTLTGLLEKCFCLTRLDSIYAAMPGGEAKSTNLQTFYQLAADFEMGNHRDLGQFLDHLTALEEKGLISAGTTGTDCVTIMSIHKSKGLEFPVVFLCGLSRSFNRESLRAQILCDKELGLGLSAADRATRVRYPTVSKRSIAAKMASESLSEEMRVLYVAMTRARDRLVMTYAAQNLQSRLQEIAMRMDHDKELLCRDVPCPGDWVLLAAMERTEAGELFALGGRPSKTKVSDIPWKICVSEAPEITRRTSDVFEEKEKLPKDAADALRRGLEFRYSHACATITPSKQTATGRKGRVKDSEAAENAEEPKLITRTWRSPAFLGPQIQGKAYGNAIHAALQYIRYDDCGTLAGVEAEVERLVKEGFLTPDQGNLVNCPKIAGFFQTEIGKKLLNGTPHLREFKFSILDNGSHYGTGLETEQVLLQGVVDCALLEDDGITIVDFKTDYVTEETIHSAIERYRPQVSTYGDALSRIYEMPVKAQYLYFFRLDRLVQI